MANYEAAARTDYFRVKDPEAFKADLFKVSGIEQCVQGDLPNEFCLLFEDGIPGQLDDDEDTDIEFGEFICHHLLDNSILVIFESGHERLRYCSGVAQAWRNDGKCVQIQLTDIYAKASEVFGIPEIKPNPIQ